MKYIRKSKRAKGIFSRLQWHLAEAQLLFEEEGRRYGYRKLSEYLAARKPIMACICDGEAEKIVVRERSGEVIRPKDVDGIAEAIIDLYYRWIKDSLVEYSLSFLSIERYSRKETISRLMEILHKIA